MPYSLVLLCCLMLTAFGARAAPLLLEDSSLSAGGFLERLDDPLGQLDADSALASSGWRPLPSSLSAGFVPGVIWVRMQVQPAANSPVHWMLMLSNPLLDEATLYDMAATVQELRSGEALGREHWAVNYRSVVFPLTLTDSQPHMLLLRLKSKNAMSVSVRLMPQPQFTEKISMEYLGYGLYFGINLALILFHVFFWRMTQAPESGWYLAYVSFCIWIESLTLGLPQQVLKLPMEVSDTLLGCALGLSLPVGVIFAIRQLRLDGYRRLKKVLTVASLMIGMTSALAVLTGHYQIGAPLHQVTVLLSIPLLTGLALWLMFIGHRPARYFLLLFGIYYAGIGISFLRNLGYVPTTFFTDNAVAIGALLHMLLMSMRIILHYRWLKKKTRRSEDAFTQLIQNQNAELECQIALRTHELRNEIHQSALLEEDLRESLRHEKKIREEQRDFVAMVSHEFLTPLAIISTSAQQMIRNLEGPRERNEQRCLHIHDASKRLMSLVDNYLNHDRMTECTTELRRADHDLMELLKGCMGEFPSTRTQLYYRASRRHINCDFGLLRVALRNLLANADRHAPVESLVLLEVLDTAMGVQIRVSNQGAEIPTDQAQLLFKKYFRGTQSLHSLGAGLGLYLVKRIAELHDGNLILGNRGENGPISFHLDLPKSA